LASAKVMKIAEGVRGTERIVTGWDKKAPLTHNRLEWGTLRWGGLSGPPA
jgi:hypothetical protein